MILFIEVDHQNISVIYKNALTDNIAYHTASERKLSLKIQACLLQLGIPHIIRLSVVTNKIIQDSTVL